MGKNKHNGRPCTNPLVENDGLQLVFELKSDILMTYYTLIVVHEAEDCPICHETDCEDLYDCFKKVCF